MLSGEVKKPDGYCAACRKHFNTEGAFENHLKSKKHRESAAAFDKRKDKVCSGDDQPGCGRDCVAKSFEMLRH